MSTLSRFQSDCWQPISSIGLPTVGYPSIQVCLMSCSLGIPRFFGQSHLQRRNFTTWALWRHHGSNLRRCGQAFRCSCLVQSWAANRRWINKCVAKVVQSSSKVQNESALVTCAHSSWNSPGHSKESEKKKLNYNVHGIACWGKPMILNPRSGGCRAKREIVSTNPLIPSQIQ